MSNSSVFDPTVFDPKNVDEETAGLNAAIEKAMAAAPPMQTLKPQEIRDQRESGESIWGPIVRLDEAQDRMIPGPGGDIRVRVFIPETINGVYLYIHGGGFMLMRADYFDQALSDISKTCRVAVVSVDYRLAPEDPYPAGSDDCEAAALWLVEKAKSEFGTENLLIGGESAGGNLSVATLLRLRDRHGFTGFRGANLGFGIYDLSGAPSARNWGERNLILSKDVMDWFNENYVSAEKMRDPDVSPLYAGLADMPPALFTVGTEDPLLDDSLFMHARWMAAGNEAELAVYPGGAHGFTAFPIAIAQQAKERVYEFMIRTVKAAN